MNEASNDSPRKPQPTVMTKVIQQNGRWIVYLNVSQWEDEKAEFASDESPPITEHWFRINDFDSKAKAETAAKWYQRGADKNIRRPPGFDTFGPKQN